MFVLIGTILFWLVFILGIVVGSTLKKEVAVVKNKAAAILNGNKKADFVHTLTDVEEAVGDNHRREAESGVVFDI